MLVACSCSLTPTRVDQFDAAKVGPHEKAVYGNLRVLERGRTDVTDRCMVWFRTPLTNTALVLPASGDFAQVVDADDERLYKLQCKLDEGLVIEDIRFLFYEQRGPGTRNYLGHITFSIDPKDPGIAWGDAAMKGALRELGATTAPLEIRPGITSDSDVGVANRHAAAQSFYEERFGDDALVDGTTLLHFRFVKELYEP